MSTKISEKGNVSVNGFGTAPVFFTAISTILGAILFLRFGFAVGTLGFLGVILIIVLGHLVTIPTALAISEISTNQRVEGGGEYFIISRSFGLNIGATIGIALFLSQAISVAFYVIAFTEAFEPFFSWYFSQYGIELPKQVISLPAMVLLALLILTKGANLGVKALYFVVVILLFSLTMFFIGNPEANNVRSFAEVANDYTNRDHFFLIFAIVFPAFTGMTAGVGLSGDLKKPSKSIPIGTMAATLAGMVIYVFIIIKLATSADVELLTNEPLVMSRIALFGPIVIPLGLAASTISSALGSIMVAPRTLQALAIDKSFPVKGFNRYLAKVKPGSNEPRNASLIVILIAFVFVGLGNVDMVAQIISMFFMVTYGSLNLISLLNHFGADPSYRPSFKSKWYLSLLGFLMSLWLMFQMNALYAFASIVLMALLYLYMNNYHKNRQGLEVLFKGALFQLNRRLQVYLQKSKKKITATTWRPSVVCVSKDSFKRNDAFRLLNWISFNHGFGTYIHLIEGYYSKVKYEESKEIMDQLIRISERIHSNVYLDTIISPSYTSAIAQIIQLPGISGMENNMVLFEFDKEESTNLTQIIDNFKLVRAGKFDICILGSSRRKTALSGGIHIWIQSTDAENSNLMILLSFIILGHPDWKKQEIKIFDICMETNVEKVREKLLELISTGRLPIMEQNINIIQRQEHVSAKSLINEQSKDAGLVMVGFRAEQLKHDEKELFEGYTDIGNVLFVNSFREKEIK
jgi:amino acid transporter